MLSFDREVVSSALDKVQYGKGEDYINKIINIPLEVPEFDSNTLHDIFISKINDIAKEDIRSRIDFKVDILLYRGILPYMKSLRIINRFIRFFEFKYSLIGARASIIDLLAITCVQIFEPKLYKEIYQQGLFQINGINIRTNNTEARRRALEEAEEIFKPVKSNCNEAISFYVVDVKRLSLNLETAVIIDYLFDCGYKIKGVDYDPIEFEPQLSPNALDFSKRLRVLKNFELYFTLSNLSSHN